MDVIAILLDLRNFTELFCEEVMAISCSSKIGMSGEKGGLFSVKKYK
jgi:hypothetical protein